ncbi:MAG: substrate-binding domain-containing protein [Deltaproteobacteria bacterium]
MRFSVFAVLVLSLSVGLAGCGGGEQPAKPEAGSGGKKKYRIAVIPKGTTHDFWKSVHYGAQQAADELGNVELVWNGPDNEKDKEGQIKIVDTFVGERVDGICLAPIDRDSLVPAVRRAKQRGIPVVIFDSALSDLSDAVSYVATDNYHGGVMAGKHLAKILEGKGGVILLRYQAGSESTEQREQGFLDALKEHEGIKVLSESQRVDSDAVQALKVGESVLRNFKDEVAGAFTVCEPNNKGMLQALENEKLAGKVRFIAFDSDPRILQGMKDKSVDGVMLQDPERMGYLSVKTIVAHLNGEEVEKRIPTGEKLATAENMGDPEMRRLLEPRKFGE